MATSSGTGSRTIAVATTRAGECGWWRLEPACRKAPARSAPSRLLTWPRLWREFSGSRCLSVKARRSGRSPSEFIAAMQFNAGLIGDAAALARNHEELLGRLPATVYAFILLELQKWPTLFGP